MKSAKTKQLEIKAIVFGKVAEIGKAVSSPKRLELLDLLSQGAKSVETLAQNAAISVKLASAHLRELKSARLVESHRRGKYVIYELEGDRVAQLWAKMVGLAEMRIADEIALEFGGEFASPEEINSLVPEKLMERARKGEVLLIDVRSRDEYDAGHFPFAISLPIAELPQRLRELPRRKEVIACCRGRHCLQASQAVAILRKHGYKASRVIEGVMDWQALGIQLEK